MAIDMRLKAGDRIYICRQCDWSVCKLSLSPGDTLVVEKIVQDPKRGVTYCVNESSLKSQTIFESHFKPGVYGSSIRLTYMKKDGEVCNLRITGNDYAIIEQAVPAEPLKCTCDSFDLMNYGCRCGAFKKNV